MNSEVRILHVDDEPVICDLTKLSLEKNGRLKVDVVHSAEEALERIRSGSYSCIISDYEMPIMNGLDFLKEVRSIDPDIPFILFSGRGREAVIIDAINTGADFYIQKGGDPKALFAELNHKVEYAIQQRNTRMALKRRDGILEAVSLVANLFLGGEPFERALQEAITLFGLATEVDTVRLFALHSDGPAHDAPAPSYVQNKASWTRIAIHPDPYEQYIRSEKIPVDNGLLDRLSRGETLILNESEIQKYYLFNQGLTPKSIAIFPVFVDQNVWGVLWFTDFMGGRIWSGVEIDALLAASAMIGSAIQQDQMRRSLIQAKEKYASMYSLMRRLCDTVPDILWAKDQEGSFLFVNQAGADLLSAGNTDDLVGKKEEDCICGIPHSFQSETGHTILPSNGRFTLKTGSGITELDILTVPFVNHQGEPIGTVTLGRDITSICQIKQGLVRSKERYENIIQAIHIGVIVVSKDGIIKDVNPRAQELLSVSKEEMIGTPLRKNRILREMELSDAVREVLQGGAAISYLTSHTITGTKEDLHCMVRLLVPENGGDAEVLITIDPHYIE
ncbi:response regulator [Methanospirillum sp.]|uniref:response regulator n=1 Tax=Methanospirillum sp. TaxID=45200 RepID=UPI002BF44956|nr:response regulator [Methanospirillum sp.]HPP77837.1 response regulator [Methanospirillum sp.]